MPENELLKALRNIQNPPKPKPAQKPGSTGVPAIDKQVAIRAERERKQLAKVEKTNTVTYRRQVGTSPIKVRPNPANIGEARTRTAEAEMADYDRRVFGIVTSGDFNQLTPEVIKRLGGVKRAKQMFAERNNYRDTKAIPMIAEINRRNEAYTSGGLTQEELDQSFATNAPTALETMLGAVGSSGVPGIASAAYRAATGQQGPRERAPITRFLAEGQPGIATDNDAQLFGRAVSTVLNQPVSVTRAGLTGDARQTRELGAVGAVEELGNFGAGMMAGGSLGTIGTGTKVAQAAKLLSRALVTDAPGYAVMIKDSGGIGQAVKSMAESVGYGFSKDASPADTVNSVAMTLALLGGAYHMGGKTLTGAKNALKARLPKEAHPKIEAAAKVVEAPVNEQEAMMRELLGEEGAKEFARAKIERRQALPARPQPLALGGRSQVDVAPQPKVAEPAQPVAKPAPNPKAKPVSPVEEVLPDGVVEVSTPRGTRYAKTVNGVVPQFSELHKTAEEASRYTQPQPITQKPRPVPTPKGPKLTGQELSQKGRDARAEKSLNETRVRWTNTEGNEVIGSLREHADDRLKNGYEPVAREVTDFTKVRAAEKIIEQDRARSLRSSMNDSAEAFHARKKAVEQANATVKNPPKITKYYATNDPDRGGGIVLSKAEYDYMVNRKAEMDATPQPEMAEPAKPVAKPAPKPVAEPKAPKAEAAPVAKAPAKEPWEMTRDEFWKYMDSPGIYRGEHGRKESSYKRRGFSAKQYIDEIHYSSVLGQFSKDMSSVPAAVLADYPELAPKAPKVAEAAAVSATKAESDSVPALPGGGKVNAGRVNTFHMWLPLGNRTEGGDAVAAAFNSRFGGNWIRTIGGGTVNNVPDLLAYVKWLLDKDDLGTVRVRSVKSRFDGTGLVKGDASAVEVFPANGKDGLRIMFRTEEDAAGVVAAIKRAEKNVSVLREAGATKAKSDQNVTKVEMDAPRKVNSTTRPTNKLPKSIKFRHYGTVTVDGDIAYKVGVHDNATRDKLVKNGYQMVGNGSSYLYYSRGEAVKVRDFNKAKTQARYADVTEQPDGNLRVTLFREDGQPIYSTVREPLEGGAMTTVTRLKEIIHNTTLNGSDPSAKAAQKPDVAIVTKADAGVAAPEASPVAAIREAHVVPTKAKRVPLPDAWAKEKVSKTTGLRKSQVQFLGDEINKGLDQLPEKMDGETIKAFDDNVVWGPRETKEQYFASGKIKRDNNARIRSRKPSIEIAVPGDGTWKIFDKDQAAKLKEAIGYEEPNAPAKQRTVSIHTSRVSNPNEMSDIVSGYLYTHPEDPDIQVVIHKKDGGFMATDPRTGAAASLRRGTKEAVETVISKRAPSEHWEAVAKLGATKDTPYRYATKQSRTALKLKEAGVEKTTRTAADVTADIKESLSTLKDLKKSGKLLKDPARNGGKQSGGLYIPQLTPEGRAQVIRLAGLVLERTKMAKDEFVDKFSVMIGNTGPRDFVRGVASEAYDAVTAKPASTVAPEPKTPQKPVQAPQTAKASVVNPPEPSDGKPVFQSAQDPSDRLRSELGWAPVSRGGRPLADVLASPVVKDIAERGGEFAREWQDSPRALTAEETAGLGAAVIDTRIALRNAEIEHQAMTTAGKMYKAADIAEQIDKLSEDLANLTYVVSKSGSEWGMAGLARQMELRRGNDRSGLQYRLRRAKRGQKPSAAEVRVAEQIGKKFEDIESEIQRRVDKIIADRFDLPRRVGRTNGARFPGVKKTVFTDEMFKAAITKGCK